MSYEAPRIAPRINDTGEGKDPSQSRFNVGGEGHWIEAAAGGAKLRFGFFADFGAGQQPIAGRGGGVVFLANFVAYPCKRTKEHLSHFYQRSGDFGIYATLQSYWETTLVPSLFYLLARTSRLSS